VSWLTRAEQRESDCGMTIHETRVAYDPPETAGAISREAARTLEQPPCAGGRAARE
jgi:hypothetical protein